MNKKMIITILLMAIGAIILYLLFLKDYLPDTTHTAYWGIVALGIIIIAYKFKENKSVSWDDDVSEIVSDSSLEKSVKSYFSGS